jgi:OmpA-OmpF porin, OOP family
MMIINQPKLGLMFQVLLIVWFMLGWVVSYANETDKNSESLVILSQPWPTPDVERQEIQTAITKLQQEKVKPPVQRAPENADDFVLQENISKLNRRLNQIDRYRIQPQNLTLPEDWRKTYRLEKNGSEADLLVQVGDIDNLGFGWPTNFDPFSGQSTPPHPFPWRPEADDPEGTDRVMVITGFTNYAARADGYAGNTSQPQNTPRPVTINYKLDGLKITSAALQLFVDDFQAPVWGNRFEVKLDGQSAPDIASTINQLKQTGPIGKLITVQLLNEYLYLLEDGKLEIFMNDSTTNVGDGFAFDFVRLLINPKAYEHIGNLRGRVIEAGSRQPLQGVLVSASNVKQIQTDSEGRFELTGVPAGMVVTTASHPDYLSASAQSDLLAGKTVDLVLELKKQQQTSEALAVQLEREGKVDLYGIYFDLDKDILRADSEPTLQQILGLMKKQPNLKIIIAGHTDSEGGDDYNLALSKRRAAAVVNWLTIHGIATTRMESQGFGETQPVADNNSATGRALNRRVEIRDANRNE